MAEGCIRAPVELDDGAPPDCGGAVTEPSCVAGGCLNGLAEPARIFLGPANLSTQLITF